MTRHSSLGDSPYNCPHCDARGTVECSECGTEHECEECRGTGWDPAFVDVDAFWGAALNLDDKIRDAGRLMLTHEWIENGRRLGRDGGPEFGRVAVADFLLEKGGG